MQCFPNPPETNSKFFPPENRFESQKGNKKLLVFQSSPAFFFFVGKLNSLASWLRFGGGTYNLQMTKIPGKLSDHVGLVRVESLPKIGSRESWEERM